MILRAQIFLRQSLELGGAILELVTANVEELDCRLLLVKHYDGIQLSSDSDALLLEHAGRKWEARDERPAARVEIARLRQAADVRETAHLVAVQRFGVQHAEQLDARFAHVVVHEERLGALIKEHQVRVERPFGTRVERCLEDQFPLQLSGALVLLCVADHKALILKANGDVV